MKNTSKILIVDDESFGRETLRILLASEEYELAFAANGKEALMQAHTLMPDLILLDVMMPDMDGFEVCRRLRDDALLSEVPILIITGLDDQESRIQGIEAGADDVISKPFDRIVLQARVRTTTRLNRYRRLMDERTRFERVVELSPDGIIIVGSSGTILLMNPMMRSMLKIESDASESTLDMSVLSFVAPDQDDYFWRCLDRIVESGRNTVGVETRLKRLDGTTFPVEVMCGHISWDGRPAVQIGVRDITERKRAELHLKQAKDELAQAYDATLEGWVRALDLRDHETEGHSQRVTELTVRLSQEIGINGEALEHIRRGALLHDIGKMGIPDSILLKPGPLTDEEWAIMRKHPVYAYEWLSPIAYLRPAMDIPYCHHEKWSGMGYPRGLKGEEIPLAARIFAVVDVWDALSHERPYHDAWPRQKVLEHIQAQSGKHFDPLIVETFLKIIAMS